MGTPFFMPEYKEGILIEVTQVVQYHKKRGRQVFRLYTMVKHGEIVQNQNHQAYHRHEKSKRFSPGNIAATFYCSPLRTRFARTTTNYHAQYYSIISKEKVKPVIRSKRRVCFVRDNVYPYTAALKIETLRKLKWDVQSHLQYRFNIFGLFSLLMHL